MDETMFDNYFNVNPNYIPDNRVRFLCRDKQDEIVVGGSITHVFKLHFRASEACAPANWFQITYKQSMNIIYTCDIQTPGVEVDEPDTGNSTIISVTLSPETTALFRPHRDTFAQIRIKLNNGEIIYGDINEIKVIDTLSDPTPYIEKEVE